MNGNMKDIMLFCSNTKVLYVEDNETARLHTMELLSRFFNNITTAENGEEALKLFHDNDIDLIISDINMPKMGGIEMSEKIREIDQNITIILLSAHNETHFKNLASNVAGTVYLEKPLNLGKFIETLKSCINK